MYEDEELDLTDDLVKQYGEEHRHAIWSALQFWHEHWAGSADEWCIRRYIAAVMFREGDC